jgi:hypothetical protein
MRRWDLESILEFNTVETDDDEILDQREGSRLDVILEEFAGLDVRFFHRAPRSGGRIPVRLGRGADRCDLRRALVDHRRILFHGRVSARSAFARLAMHLARADNEKRGQLFPFLIEVEAMASVRVEEEELARRSPPLGVRGVRRLLREGRAVVLVDRADNAEDPGELARSIAALAAEHPLTRFFVTIAPTGAGSSKVRGALSGFVSAGPAQELENEAPIPLHDPTVEALQDRARALHARVTGAVRRLAAAPTFRHLSTRAIRALLADLAEDLHTSYQIGCAAHRWTEMIAEILESPWYTVRGDKLAVAAVRSSPEPKRRLPIAAADLWSELQSCTDLFTETCPGWFTFADFALQEHLTAAYCEIFVTESALMSHTDDPWWAHVFVYRALMPRSHPAGESAVSFLAMLLEYDGGVHASLLADLCARCLGTVPAAIRAEIETRLRRALPPRYDVDIEQYSSLDPDLLVPKLLELLPSADAEGRAGIASVLGKLGHPRAPSVLARLALDEQRTAGRRLLWLDLLSDGDIKSGPVASFALAALFNLTLAGRPAKAHYERALLCAPPSALKALNDVLSEVLRPTCLGTASIPEHEIVRVRALRAALQAAMARGKSRAVSPGSAS